MHKKLRTAIAMIELIFAIVVMGIVLMSAPTLIGVATKSGKSGSLASFQESITETSSLIKLITTRYWDQNDTNNSSPLLQRGIGVSITDPFPGRVSRKRVDGSGNLLLMSNIGSDTNEINNNDMDDFNGFSTTITLTTGAPTTLQGITDYIDFDVNLTAQVQYGKLGTPGDEPFSAGGLGGLHTRRNTKLITVTLTSPHFPDKNISLSTFSCNIGSYQIRELGVNR